MICPFCLHKKSEIYNSRTTKNGTVVWRRRRCLQCRAVFTTQEAWDPTGSWRVQDSSGNIRPYDRARLLASILRVCDHRESQVASAWYIFQSVEEQLYSTAVSGNHVVDAQKIIECAGALLRRFDPTAYIKYLSYHQPAMDSLTLRKHLRKG